MHKLRWIAQCFNNELPQEGREIKEEKKRKKYVDIVVTAVQRSNNETPEIMMQKKII